MPYVWPEETDFALWELDVTDRKCPACGRKMAQSERSCHQVPAEQSPLAG
jgi:hypothetical protein